MLNLNKQHRNVQATAHRDKLQEQRDKMVKQDSAWHATQAEHVKVQAKLKAEVAALQASLHQARQDLVAAQRRAQLQDVRVTDAVALKEVRQGCAATSLFCQ